MPECLLKEYLTFVAALMLWPANRWAVIQGTWWVELARRGGLHDGPLPTEPRERAELIRKWQDMLPPHIVVLQDFIPAVDDGTIRYWLGGETYKYFYGSDLEVTNDRLTHFEHFHSAFASAYRELYRADPIRHLELCLRIQNHVLERLGPVLAGAIPWESSLGNLELPSEEFQRAVREAIWLPSSVLENWLEGWSEGEKQRFRQNFIASPIASDPLKPWDDLFTEWEQGVWPGSWGLDFGDHIMIPLPKTLSASLLGHFAGLFESLPEASVGEDFPRRQFAEALAVTSIRELGGDVRVCTWPERPQSSQQNVDMTVLASGPEILMFVLFCKRSEVADAGKAFDTLTEAARLYRKQEQIANAWFHCIAVYLAPGLAGTPMALPERADDRTTLKIMGYWDLVGLLETAEDWQQIAQYLRAEWEMMQQAGRFLAMNALDTYPLFERHQAFAFGGTRPDFIWMAPGDWTERRYDSLHQFWKAGPFCLETHEHPRTWRIEKAMGNDLYGVVRRDMRLPAMVLRLPTWDLWLMSPHPRELEQDEAQIVILLLQCLEYYLGRHRSEIASLFASSDRSPRQMTITAIPVGWLRRTKDENAVPSQLESLDPRPLAWAARQRDGVAECALVFEPDALGELFGKPTNEAERLILRSALAGLCEIVLGSGGSRDATEFVDRRVPPGTKKFSAYHISLPVRVPAGYPNPLEIGPGARTRARQEVAEIIGQHGWQAGEYTGEHATRVLNSVVDFLWADLQRRLSGLHGERLVHALIEQCEQSLHGEFLESEEHAHALTHFVEYDPVASLAEAAKKTTSFYRACRLAIEAAVATGISPQGLAPSPRDLEDLLATAQVLDNLIQASDSLHYQTAPFTLRIADDLFIADWEFKDPMATAYESQRAAYRLRVGVSYEDAHLMSDVPDQWLPPLDAAFLEQFGFSLSDLAAVEAALAQPTSAVGLSLSWAYQAQSDHVARAAATLGQLDPERARAALEYLILSPGQLTGWHPSKWRELKKRPERFSLKPLVGSGEGDSGILHWGPYTVRKTMALIFDSAADGMWPVALPSGSRVAQALQRRHRQLEARLEEVGVSICSRHFDIASQGVDLHRRFPLMGFPADLGDYDALAILRTKSIVAALETKHVRPAFVPKDVDSLRKDFQDAVAKHRRRVEFASANLPRIVSALMPGVVAGPDWRLIHAFVCSDLVAAAVGKKVAPDIEFLTVGQLDSWLRNALGALK